MNVMQKQLLETYIKLRVRDVSCAVYSCIGRKNGFLEFLYNTSMKKERQEVRSRAYYSCCLSKCLLLESS